jgi:DNA polymerase-3 subunit delta
MDLDGLTADRLAPVYIVVSPDPLLSERAFARIRELAVPEAARAFNYDVYDGKGASGARILAAAQTLPMMASRRLVVVRDIGAMAAAELAKLIDYLGDPCETTVLVATAQKVDKRIKFYATAKKKKFLHELAPPRNATPWLRDEARRRGVDITPAAVTRLADVVGNGLARLALSLDQLALYAGGRKVDVDDVDDLVAETRERTVFELTDAIGQGDRQRALVALGALLDQRQSSIGVVMMLARHVRQLALAQAGLDKRLPKGELGKLLGVPPFVVDKLATQARRFQPVALDRAIRRLAEADFALKGGRPMLKTLGRDLGDRVVLDRLVAELLVMSR